VDEIDRDTAEFLEATGLTQLPDDLVDLIIGAANTLNECVSKSLLPRGT
jgi:hypothetical protein